MFKSVLGAISADMALDLGSSTTRVWVSGRGLSLEEPTAIAMMLGRRGEQSVLAVGKDAAEMEGRCPGDIEVNRPVQDGQVTDFGAIELMLRHWVLQVQGRRLWVGPRMVFTIPYGTTDVEQRALRESAEAAGAREVMLVEQPLASTLGCDLPINAARGHMLVDIGATTTSVSIVSLGGVVYACTLPIGGDSMDREIVLHMRDHRGMHISRREAEHARLGSVSFFPNARTPTALFKGRDVRSGFPKTMSVDSEELTMALQPIVNRLSDVLIQALERIPADLASDVAELGILVCGGCAQMPGLDQALGRTAGLPLMAAERPEMATVIGAARFLEEPSLGALVAG